MERSSSSIACSSSWVRRARSVGTVPSLGTCSVSASSSASAHVEQRARRGEAARVGEAQADVAVVQAALELLRRAGGDDRAVVEDRDPVRELVRLVEVLGGQEDRHAAGRQRADDLPHRAPAARVQARRRLVEEDHARVADERHGQVEPALHAAGVGHGRLVGRVDEVELLEQLRRARPCAAAGRGGAGRPSASGSRARTAGRRWPRTGR